MALKNSEYWYYPEDELDNILCKFWFEVRTQHPGLDNNERDEALKKNQDPYPERYTIASLRNLRNGLSRCLTEHGKSIDLTNDSAFKKSQKSFKDACKELKQLGKGHVASYPEIQHAGDC